jgi:predicted kinase
MERQEFIDKILTSIDQELVILRGIPGSGKSSFAQEIMSQCQNSKNFLSCCICSADDFFVSASGYVFDKNKLGQAHDSCKKKCKEALVRGSVSHCYVVIIDNTNMKKWQYQEYETMAREKGYKINIVQIKPRDEVEARGMGERNTHGVTMSGVLRMFRSWEEDVRAITIPACFQ